MTQETPQRRLVDRGALNRRASDRDAMPLFFQKRLQILKITMQCLCLMIIALQGFDAISTFMALNTGHLFEKNVLLVTAAYLLNAPIANVVLGAKLLVAVLFGWLMFNTKPSLNAVAALFFVAVFYVIVVHNNFYWVSVVQTVRQ